MRARSGQGEAKLRTRTVTCVRVPSEGSPHGVRGGTTRYEPQGTPMSIVTMRDMLEAGVHFGHQSRYWNPKMAPYIFGERNRIHIINLEVTLPLYREAINFLGRMAASNGTVLFVGTKRAAQDVIRREAIRCGMPYVDQRWLGGMLTNFKTVRASIARLREMEAMEEDGRVQRMSKKEALSFRRSLSKLQRSLGGIKHTESLPDVLYVVDVGHEKIAVMEADKLGIPIVGVVDTNHEPDRVDYVIPGNDDAARAIELYTVGVADAIIEARQAAHLEVGPDSQGDSGRGAEETAPGNGEASAAAVVSSAPEPVPAAANGAAAPAGDPAAPEPAAASGAAEPDEQTLADRIRQHVITHDIVPARDAGQGAVSIRAGAVHGEMGLQDRMPAVCAALDAQDFLDQAGVEMEERSGPPQGAAARFVFRIIGSAEAPAEAS